jgi:rhodanese-related sulfurtransferase
MISEILQRAQQRAREMNLPYEGALLPAEAFEIMQHAPGAKLVDIRTRAELYWVGRIPGSIEIEWQSFPGMQLNPHFLNQLEQQVEKEALTLFICRSGARSHGAATLATQNGWNDCYNVIEGFEGDKDQHGHRNVTGGWRAARLPWYQG